MPEKSERSAQRIDAEENVTRYVGGAHFDPYTGQINASAFDRTLKDLDGLSVNRVGLLNSNKELDRIELRRVMGSRMTFGKTAIFVEINIGAAMDALKEFSEEIYVISDPLPAEDDKLANPAHSLFIGLPFKGETIGSLKSELAGDRLRAIVCDKFPAISEN